MASSTRPANRRSSPRGSPTAPRHTWHCSVSLRAKRTVGAGSAGAGSIAGALAARWSPTLAWASSTSWSWSTEPAAAMTTDPGHVARGVEGADLVDRRVADHRRAADDRAAQRVAAEDRLAEHVEDRVLRIVLVHGDLLEHDLALGVDLTEGGPPHHVGDDVEGAREVLVEHPRVDCVVLSLSVPALSSAHAVEQLVDLRPSRSGRCRGTAGARGSARAPPGREPPRASPRPRRTRGPRTGRRASPPSRSAARWGSSVIRWAGRGLAPLGIAVPARGALGAVAVPRPRPLRRPSRPPPRPPRSPPRPPPPLSPVPTDASSSLVLPAMSGSSARRRPMRPRSRSTSTTRTEISSPLLRTSSTVPTRWPGETLEMCSRPSVPLASSTNAPNVVVLTTFAPGNSSPTSTSLVIERMRSASASPWAPVCA